MSAIADVQAAASPGPLSFPPSARLLSRREFTRVYQEGRMARHPWLVLFHAPSIQGPDAATRFGFTVSRKVARRATARSRIRRVWREAARLTRHQFASGWDIVLNARASAGHELRNPQAQAVLLELAARQGLLRPIG